MKALARLTAIFLSAGTAVSALDLTLTHGARQTAERITGPDSYRAPVAAFDGQGVPSLEIEGLVARRAYRLAAEGLTTLQVMTPLRQQILDQGFEVIFECDTDPCGGFDFRFETEVLPGPNMYVNLSRFRSLTARRGKEAQPSELVTVLVSATAASAYVQLIHARREDIDKTTDIGATVATPDVEPSDLEPAPTPPPAPGSIVGALERNGFAELEGLTFATGTTDLGPGPFASLEALAEALKQNPGWRVALVGHTDSVGGLDGNIAISRARARSVRNRLVGDYGIDAGRLEAQGMGYLAPRASNLTEAGRAENRRVEVILLSADE